MIYIFLTFLVLGGAFAQLGAVSVWANVLASAFKFAMFLILGLLGFLFWRRNSQKNDFR